MASKKKSEIWTVFEEISNIQAKCHFCSQILSHKGGSTYNLHRHLKSKHPASFSSLSTSKNNRKEHGAGECAVDDPSPIRPQEYSPVPSTSTNTNFAKSDSTDSASIVKKKEQKTLGAFFTKPVTNKKREDINKHLVNTIAKNFLSFYLVESDYFKAFVRELNPGYQLPTRKTISNVLLPKYYNITKEVIFNKVQLAEAVSLTTDGWTSVTNESYISVTAHYFYQNKLESSLLDCYKYTESHTASNLCDELQRIVRDWQITNKIVAVVSDNAANIVAAIRQTGWKHIPCFAHTINLIVQSSLDIIKPIRQKVKLIVDFFRRSSQAAEKLKQMQKQLELPQLKIKQDVVTRWNSTYDMFRRILDIKEPLMSVIAVHYQNIDNLTNSDINILEKCCEVLKVFKDVTEEISSEKQVTISKVILFSAALTKFCHTYVNDNPDLPEMCQVLVESLQANIHKRFSNIQQNKIFAESTILDPRFKKYGFSDKTAFDSIKQHLINYVKSSIADIRMENTETEVVSEFEKKSENPSILWQDFDFAVSKVVSNSNPIAAGIIEVEKYLEEPLLPRQEDPFIWWEERKKVYPTLYKLMKQRLCVVATSVPSERIFSKAGQTLTEKRSNLHGNKVSMLIFLNANL